MSVVGGVVMDGGFRGHLGRAMRITEDGVDDWSPHTIDYTRFKQRLKYFARRRAQIRQILQNSPDATISEQVLFDLLGPKTKFPCKIQYNNNNNTILAKTPLSYSLSMDPQAMRQPPAPLRDDEDGPPDIINIPSTEYMEMTDGVETPEIAFSGSSDMSNNLMNADPRKRRRHQRSVLRRLSISERNEIMLFLDWEMDKAFMFYLTQWQKLSTRLEASAPYNGDGSTSLDFEIGDEILEIISFCTINIVTAQQILIRYDAFARAFEGSPVLEYYMKKVTRRPTSFRKLLHHEEVQAIASAFTENAEGPYVDYFESQRTMFTEILESIVSTESIDSRNGGSCTDALVYSLRRWLLVGLWEDRLGLEPAYLMARGKSLTMEMERLAQWRQQKHDMTASRLRRTLKEKKLTAVQIFNLTLNLLAAFLYCMNYYIVEPSSTMYVNRLGAHDAMSGTLIGMMPLAAFVSSIPYSMWTNRSFRNPFLMSCCMLIFGNLLYSLADLFGVLPVALLGRFVCGLGAPKCIIRRYMADTTPVSLRTSVNAGFGMVVAAGSAMGPAMAIVLNRFDYSLNIWPNNARTVYLNGLTLPGYFMATLWLTFLIIVLATFEEPDRDGLKEQQEMEMNNAIASNISTVSSNNWNDSSREKEEISTIFSGESGVSQEMDADDWADENRPKFLVKIRRFLKLITFPVRLCLGMLFFKVFVIESLVSATSALTKNRYKWQVKQVGTLGLVNGILVIPFSILVGRLSMSYQDHVLMKGLLSMGCFGLFLLIDLSDLVATPTRRYNEGHVLAVSPQRYIIGYFLSYISIQAFEGVIGSTLSKVIPTALASGTVNSGLLATLVDTFGRTCGDLFISTAGFISLRQLMNLLFIPGFTIMLTCLVVVERYKDMLSV
jgi:hypothetical protein